MYFHGITVGIFCCWIVSEKGLKGIIANQTCPSLNGRSLEITATIIPEKNSILEMKWFRNLFRKVEFREISGWNGNRKYSSLRYVTKIFFRFREWKPEISWTLFRNFRKILEKFRFLFQKLIFWFYIIYGIPYYKNTIRLSTNVQNWTWFMNNVYMSYRTNRNR